jgi:hypothetical protein
LPSSSTRPAGAAQHGADAAAQLGQAERLGDVVVGAGLEALHRVGLAVERGEHDDRDHVALGAQLARDVVARRPRPQRDVEQHHVEAVLRRVRERLLAVGHRGDVVALARERALDQRAEVRLVVDDQDLEGARHAPKGRGAPG